MKQREGDGHVYGHMDDFDYVLLVVAGWMFANRGKRFALESLAEDVGVSVYYCKAALQNEQLTGLFTEVSGGTQAYQSTAPELEPTQEGLQYEAYLLAQGGDWLGEEARAEFYRRANGYGENLGRRRRDTGVKF